MTQKRHACIDCGVACSGIRCRSCAVKQQWIDKPKRTKKTFIYDKKGKKIKRVAGKCVDCGKQLKSYVAKRCYVCGNTGKHNPSYGTTKDNCGSKNPNFGNRKYTEEEAIANGRIGNWYKWRNFRKEILERDNHTCTNCGKMGKAVHHIKNRKDFPELMFDKNNVATLCTKCHTMIDGHKNPKGNNQYVKR